MELGEKLAMLGGAARRSELVRTAADRRLLADELAGGALRDLGGGWVADIRAEPAMVAARRLGGTVTCVSAASVYGLQLLKPPDRPHVAIPRTRSVRRVRDPATVHRESRWTRPTPSGAPLAPPAEVVGRVLRCCPATEAAVITDSALNRGLVTAEEVAAMLVGPGSPQARAVLDRCHPRSRSVIETVARLALEDAGLSVEAGVVIAGVGEVDLLVLRRVVVECDGFAYHSGRREYREDRRRDRVLAAGGFTVLRFTWEEIMNDPDVVVRAVLRVLA